MVIFGYRIQKVSDLNTIEDELNKVRRSLHKIRVKEYHRLWGQETAFLCDCISLNILTRNGENIPMTAKQNLDTRIRNAEYLGMQSPYHLSVYVNVMIYEGDTYLKVLCQNPLLLKAFRGLEEFHLSETECQDPHNQKKIVWEKLHSLYESNPPLTMNLALEIQADPKQMKYPDKKLRAQTLARQNLTSQYLNMIGGGGQIPPHLLMPYLDEALSYLVSENAKNELQKKTLHLENILIDLEEDDSFLYPQEQKGEQQEPACRIKMRILHTIWKEKELRKKCLFVILILIGCRILSGVPTPGVNPNYFKLILMQNSSLGFLNALTGNGLSSLSILALSVTPYITASIIIQLLGVIFPKIKELQKSPATGDKRKMKLITIASGAGLALFESLTMAIGFGKKGLLLNYKWYVILGVSLIWTLGALFLSCVGEFITQKLIGNGVSLILLTNILASYPSDARNIWDVLLKGQKTPILCIRLFLVLLLVFGLFVFTYVLQETEKTIPVNYTSKSMVGMPNKLSNEIPIKLCPGSVVPIIFASSLLSFPLLIADVFGTGESFILKVMNSGYWFRVDEPVYTIGAAVYILLIFGFSYFYADITINPEDIARNIQKAGGNISGIRAGKPTAEYLRSEMKHMIGIGSAALSVIALIPLIISGLTGLSRLSFLGTSIIITVGVILETQKLLITKTQGSLYMDHIKKGGLFHG